jgi:septal ring factor EnvC (AmiA/AmiB activator)
MKTITRVSPVDYCKSALEALENGDRKAAKRLLTRLVAAQVKSAKKPSPEVVVMRQLMRSTNTTTIEDALAVAETFKRSHEELAKERAAIAKEKATLEAAERRQLVVDIEKLGAPKSDVYQKMPLDHLRDLHGAMKRQPKICATMSRRFQ